MKNLSRFAKYSWFVLLFNLFIILWGGLVSASGSGDGCGKSWPLCSDEAERTTTGLETFIEVFHRATSGLALIVVVILYLWARRIFKKGNATRTASFWSLIFIIIEALIGAYIVLLGHVDTNESLGRAFSQPIHLVNTYLLVASLTLTAWWASGNRPVTRPIRSPSKKWLQFAFFGILLLSAFGTIASLATTIFPSESFLEGVQKDFSADVHYLVRLRIIHPIIATFMGGFLFYLHNLLKQLHPQPLVQTFSFYLLVLFAIQYALGAMNAVMLAPIWLQLSHLLVSDLLWMSLVLLAAECWKSKEA